MTEDWLGRWEQGRTGWHEPDGNRALRRFWPRLPAEARVLVPLCGKAVDLEWLAASGASVTGVELSEKAIRAFFAENGIDCEAVAGGTHSGWRASDRDITLFCADYFEFDAEPFDALFDRGALVAIEAGARLAYARHTDALLKPGACRLLLTLEYDQNRADGPPFAVMPDEVARYWPELECVERRNDIDNCPPKFRAAGLRRVMEAVWLPAAWVSPTARR